MAKNPEVNRDYYTNHQLNLGKPFNLFEVVFLVVRSGNNSTTCNQLDCEPPKDMLKVLTPGSPEWDLI